MDDDQLLRYSRHILLPQLGIEGQEKFRRSHALIVGAGGLGSPVALYLASAGVGTLTICDGDAVDLTNLQRQIVHRFDAIGSLKAESARRTLATLNPEVTVNAQTICIHGDTPGAPQIAAAVAQALRHAGITLRALRTENPRPGLPGRAKIPTRDESL